VNDSRFPHIRCCKATILSTLVAVALSPALLPTGSAHAAVPDHSQWENFLQKHVQAGRVDYDALKRDPSELQSYLEALAQTRRPEFYAASEKTRLAFWINAYNAFTIRLIVDHYPVASIWNVTPLWKRPLGGPFVEQFIPLGNLFPGKPVRRKLSLNDIEDEILRKDFHDPRVHFTIVCASTSCPTLSSHAYTAAGLDRQLSSAARRFVTDPSKNHYDSASNILYLSEIFRWFREDFEKRGSLVKFLRPYMDAKTLQRISAAKTGPRIEFNSYDWSLNKRAATARRDTHAEARNPG